VGASLALASAASAQSITVQSGPGAPGSPDPNVQASSDGVTFNNAFTVAPNARYSVIPGTSWDSITANGTAAPGDYVYQTSIDVPANAVNPTISGSFYSDNQGSVSVNGGSSLATNNPCGGAGEAADYGFNGGAPTTFTGSLNPGSNTLTFNVNNCSSTANPTGVDFTATVTYTLYPTSSDQCKNGGWQNLTDRNGTSFKNQGDCVSYVATGGRNTAAG
jgi:hypothetical protein